MNTLFRTAVLAIALSQPALAEKVTDGEAVFKAGNWTVYRSIDAMTDQITCTGMYKQDPAIQLSKQRLFVGMSGGIKRVTLRHGEDPAKPMRPADKSENQIDAVILDGSEFSEVLQHARLRLQVLTIVRGVLVADLNTSGIKAATANINAGCPSK